MNVTEACVSVSEKRPQEWDPEVLWPLWMLGGSKVPGSIFGSSHIAMDRGHVVDLIDALIDCGLSTSRTEAKHAIRSGAVRLNRTQVKDEKRVLWAFDALPNLDAIVLENGRFNYGIIELCDP